MTYVSRRARIIVPRWPNESDTDFLFRTRRRCDGRLKNQSSCNDLRAWINDNCIKNEYLLELMSDAEVALTLPFKLYGRFIPVPLLFKLLQNSKEIDGEGTYTSRSGLGDTSGCKGIHGAKGAVGKAPSGKGITQKATDSDKEYDGFDENGDNVQGRNKNLDVVSLSSETSDDVADGKKTKQLFYGSDNQPSSVSKVLWEKNMIEKNLFKSTCLLGKALGKLEKIDNIILIANEETQNMRKEEIHEVFRKSKISCNCIKDPNNDYEHKPNPALQVPLRGPRAEIKKLKDTAKYNELLRQISGLREKLKKNQECRQKITHELGMVHRRAESSTSAHVSEICRRREQPQIKRLQKRLERLVREKGKLLSDMCQALTCLNNFKKTTNSKTCVGLITKSEDYRKVFSSLQQKSCDCVCKYDSSGTDKAQCSDSLSSDEEGLCSSPCLVKNCSSVENENDESEQQDDLRDDQYGSPPKSRVSVLKEYKRTSSKGEFRVDSPPEKEVRKSITGGVNPQFPCNSRQLDINFSAFEECVCSQRHSVNRGNSENTGYRPSTSPTTKRERQAAWVDNFCLSCPQNSPENQGRRVKSETTMKEIEKTLRNYEQRLNDVDGLEFKVEEWKRKLLESYKLRRNMSKMEAQVKKEREFERQRSCKEITALYTENCELKRQVRQLMEKSKEQSKKLQNQKSSVLKAKDLECETEELKKELSKYRNNYEQQQKCINKWESLVAVQRKEIENLMNHIRKLTTERMKEQNNSGYHERRCAQRSRSYSPVAALDGQDLDRPKTYDLPSEDDNGSCCCQEFRQSESRRAHLKYFDRGYYSSVKGNVDWCD